MQARPAFNASGTITRCDPPNAFDVTWELGGGTSWVQVRLAPEGNKARLTLEHIAPRDGVGEEHLKKFGPAAVGVGWDLALKGLEIHVADPARTRDDAWKEAWSKSEEGKAFMRASGEAWGVAHVESGEAPPRRARRPSARLRSTLGADACVRRPRRSGAPSDPGAARRR